MNVVLVIGAAITFISAMAVFAPYAKGWLETWLAAGFALALAASWPGVWLILLSAMLASRLKSLW